MGVGKVLAGLALAAGIREGIQVAVEVNERKQVFRQARDYADLAGKPLLVVGAPKSLWNNHPGGDVTIDIDPNIESLYAYELADVRDIPYTDKYFGAAFCSHVLEHLHTADDAVKALEEMYRVADKVFVVSPHKSSLLAWANPEHHLWLIHSGDGYVIEQRGGEKPAKNFVSADCSLDLTKGIESYQSITERLGLYYDLAADVRYSNSHVPIRQLVTPNATIVRELAQILHSAPDFVAAAQQFVHEFPAYEHEPGDYWATAIEVIERESGDCDDKAILLCSLLRNYFSPEEVFCAFGMLNEGGHMWVIMEGENGEDRIVESTAPPERTIVTGNYQLEAIFNDKYAFSTLKGLKDFNLVPVEEDTARR